MSQHPDLINATFEALGGCMILLNIRRVMMDKLVRGVDWRVLGFFTAWGVWNLFYYPHLDQWFSFYAGVWITVVNTLYLILLVYYVREEKL